MSDLWDLVLLNDTFISVDNFFPHFCNIHGMRGIVLFSRSDPNIFGYERHINLLKDRKYLRPDQFMIWEACERLEEAFVDPETVINAINRL